jgi:hypothetical protein
LKKERRLKVFEKRVLRRIFGPKRDEVTGEWRQVHIEGLHGFCSSPNIIRAIRSRRMRWAGHVARMGRGEMHTGFSWEIWRGRIEKNRVEIGFEPFQSQCTWALKQALQVPLTELP